MKNIKEICKNDIAKRIENLEGRSRLIELWKVELINLKEMMSTFENIPDSFFKTVPSYGLACDWFNKWEKLGKCTEGIV